MRLQVSGNHDSSIISNASRPVNHEGGILFEVEYKKMRLELKPIIRCLMVLLFFGLVTLDPVTAHSEYPSNLSVNEYVPDSASNLFGAGNFYRYDNPTNPYERGWCTEGR